MRASTRVNGVPSGRVRRSVRGTATKAIPYAEQTARDLTLTDDPTRDYDAEAAIAGAYATGNLDNERASTLTSDLFANPNCWAIVEATRRMHDDANGNAVTTDAAAIVRCVDADRIPTADVRGGPDADFRWFVKQTLGMFLSSYDVDDAWKRLGEARARRECQAISLRLSEAAHSHVDPYAALGTLGERASKASEGTPVVSGLLAELRRYPDMQTLLADGREDTALQPGACFLGLGLLVSGSYTILAGPAGVGKTFIALQLAACLGAGKPFLGHAVHEPVRVLVLSPELRTFAGQHTGSLSIEYRWGVTLDAALSSDADKRLAMRNVRVMGGGPNFDLPPLVTSRGERNPRALRRVEELASEFRPDVIILDTVRRVAACPETSEGMNTLANALEEIARRTDAAVLAIHHYRKGSADARKSNAPLIHDDYISGGGTFVSNTPATMHAVIDRSREGHPIMFKVEKTNAGDSTEPTYLGQFPRDSAHAGALYALKTAPPAIKTAGRRASGMAERRRVYVKRGAIYPLPSVEGFSSVDAHQWLADEGVHQPTERTVKSDLIDLAGEGVLRVVREHKGGPAPTLFDVADEWKPDRKA